jgi:hypothetical protein
MFPTRLFADLSTVKLREEDLKNTKSPSTCSLSFLSSYYKTSAKGTGIASTHRPIPLILVWNQPSPPKSPEDRFFWDVTSILTPFSQQ